MARILTIILLLSSPALMAMELEGFGGVRSVTYSDVEEANTTGVSWRAKMNFYSEGSGFFFNLSTNFYTIGAGYGWRTQSNWFWEAGIGAAYSLTGPGPMIVLGTGYKINDRWFINFPLMFTGPTYWSPYIGYVF